MSITKIQLTQAGYDKLWAEYRNLLDVERPQVTEDLAAARAQGDLSENSEYHASKDRLSEINVRIGQIEDILSRYEIIDESKSGKKISLGSTVRYKELDTKEVLTVKIVGTSEANPTAAEGPMISTESALGKALIDRSVGEIVAVESNIPYEVEIVEIVKVKNKD